MEFGKRGYCGVPPGRSVTEELRIYLYIHLRPLLRCYLWDCGVFEDAPVKELHDVEVTAENTLILAECVGLWDWNICLLECMNDPIFAVDFMRRLRIVSVDLL